MNEGASTGTSWWRRISQFPESLVDASKTIDELGRLFLWLGVVHLVPGFFIRPFMVLDGAVYMGLGWYLKKFRSRTIALVLVAISIDGILSTFHNQFFGGAGGRNIVLSIIVATAAIQAFRVTLFYHKTIKSRVRFANLLIKSFWAVSYAVVSATIAIIFGAVRGMDVENVTDWESTIISVIILAAFGAAFAGALPFTRSRPITIHDEPV